MPDQAYLTSRLKLLLVVVLGLGGLGLGLTDTPVSRYVQSFLAAPREGAPAPNFTLSTLDNETITLSDLRGQVIILNLWTSWCPPCREEMPTLNEVYQTYKDDGLVVLAVNSTVQDSEAAAREFTAEYALDFPILLDHDGIVARAYQLQSLPTTFFIDRRGVIQAIVPGGPLRVSYIEAKISPLLTPDTSP
ncbi:MAG: TlpA family protein disulfide reductase [Anaerolineales bacterium]|nr:TlpA family protein disulfide reductase [Anaerolineales bacterium]